MVGKIKKVATSKSAGKAARNVLVNVGMVALTGAAAGLAALFTDPAEVAKLLQDLPPHVSVPAMIALASLGEFMRNWLKHGE
jgi:hypothetical protein